jgi:putative oxidoreductase
MRDHVANRVQALDPAQRRLAAALLILRFTLGAFLLQWGIEKFVNPNMAAGIADYFYGIPLSATLAYLHGAIEVAVALGVVLGILKRWSYGIAMIGHAVTVAVSYRQLLHPYEDINHMFAASVPVLGGFIALYMLRDRDRYALDRWFGSGASLGEVASEPERL